MSTVEGIRTRSWRRAPVDAFVEQFADAGPFGGLTQWVRAGQPSLDLHIWSDVPAGVHRARVYSGTVGLIDVVWSPHRFQITARRPFTRHAAGWLDSAWYPTRSAPARVLRAVAFGETVRALAADRARFGVAALDGLGLVTQEYAPLLAGALESTVVVGRVREALLPAPIPGGAPFFSTAPDAVVLGADGAVEFVRVYSERAPELRFAAAQALVDLGLHGDLGDSDRAEQCAHFARVGRVRRFLGLRAPAVEPARRPARALVVRAASPSPRLLDQFAAVRDRLADRGLLDAAALRERLVAAPPGERA